MDAIACWLQDVAFADVEDAGLERVAVWVVRRTRIRVHRWPRFGERFSLTTFCSGVGRMWAERRTDITRTSGPGGIDGDLDGGEAGDGGAAGADVEAVSLWVHLDPERWTPSKVTAAELAVYGGLNQTRRVSHRLRHPPPPRLDGGRPWTFRATECDIADHVNNAAYWQPLEEELLSGDEPERLDAELEYRVPAQPGPIRVVGDGERRWLVGEGDAVHASLRLDRS